MTARHGPVRVLHWVITGGEGLCTPACSRPTPAAERQGPSRPGGRAACRSPAPCRADSPNAGAAAGAEQESSDQARAESAPNRDTAAYRQ